MLALGDDGRLGVAVLTDKDELVFQVVEFAGKSGHLGLKIRVVQPRQVQLAAAEAEAFDVGGYIAEEIIFGVPEISSLTMRWVLPRTRPA